MKLFTKIAAAILSAALVFGLIACGTTSKVTYAEIALTGEQYGYCVAPNDEALLASVNELLAEIKENGKLDEIYAAEENGTAGNIGSVKTESSDRASELVVATNAEFEPFEYFQGNYFAGVDMQIAKLLAEKLGKTLVIKHMEFDSVIISVSQGLCDIGMAGLTISDGRSENVVFSDPYYDTTQIIAYVEGDETFSACKTADEVVAAIKSLSGVSAGAALGQTGELYLKGSDDFGFEGFTNVTVRSYSSIALAVRDLANGGLKFVVGDKDTVKAAVEAVNG